MLIYVHDGTFEGILTAIHETYYRRQKPDRLLSEDNLPLNILDTYVTIVTDTEKSDKVYDAVLRKVSLDAIQRAFYIYLSESPDAGTLIYKYLRLGFKVGRLLDNHLQEDDVLDAQRLGNTVSKEVHRMKGLLRFVKLQGEIYYAKYEPDNNITMLVAPHFKERLSDQNWIIHDTRRGLSAIYNKTEWIMTDNLPSDLPQLSDCELHFQSLWKEYYRSIAISERTNPRCQKNHMPVRYWRNLTEMGLC